MRLKDKALYAKEASSSLIVLWIGAIFLLLVMLYNWNAPVTDSTGSVSLLSKPETIFADQLLLSSQDLQIGENVNLINITLKREGEGKDSSVNTAPERKLVYSRILKNKIKKISSAPDPASGFKIKPLPQ
ncbi:MAG TPA: hypothetical protein PKE30_02790 [Niabella sp.]|nr:hypothetical protein [Niabella sp.]